MFQQAVSRTRWTREEDLRFEQALVLYPDGMADWDAIALHLPGKTPADLAAHYGDLLHDVTEIDAGRVDLPCYADSPEEPPSWDSSEPRSNQISFSPGKPKSDPDRKKGTPWTEEEHRLFLLGLQKYGKGDWRSISRNFVITRTPTQVASHAQKYYLRQGSGKKERKRSSIHDITSVDSASASACPPEQNNCLLPQQQTFNPPPQHQMPDFHHHQQFNDHPNGVVPMEYQHYGYPM